jgi:hypothetical protein
MRLFLVACFFVVCYIFIASCFLKGYTMQFRKQKSLIQVMRYEGYKKDTKQPIMAMVGTIDLRNFRFEKRVDATLDDVEMLEISQAIEREQLISAQERAAEAALQALDGLRKLSPKTDLSGLVKNDPDGIWTGLVAVEKALNAAGVEKPKKSRGAQSVLDSKTGDLLKP